MQIAVDGPASAALGELARERWRQATGQQPTAPLSEGSHSDPWPPELVPDVREARVGISRTLPAYDGQQEVREVERLYLDAIAAARQFIYIENQYFTSSLICEALAARLDELSVPEIVLVLPRECPGWLEESTMGALRKRALERLSEADRFGRFRAYYPVVPERQSVFVHSKVLIVDDAPEDLYNLAALLRDNESYVVQGIVSREDQEPTVAVSTTRLHNIAGRYTGKDDPIALVRTQGGFPATGEVLAPFTIGHYVAGSMRGSHTGPLMPVRLGSPVSYFDGPPVVSALAFSVHEGKLTEPADVFDHPFWDTVREHVSIKAIEIRRQGFSGPAMLPMSELEYGGIVEHMKALDWRFRIRELVGAEI